MGVLYPKLFTFFSNLYGRRETNSAAFLKKKERKRNVKSEKNVRNNPVKCLQSIVYKIHDSDLSGF